MDQCRTAARIEADRRLGTDPPGSRESGHQPAADEGHADGGEHEVEDLDRGSPARVLGEEAGDGGDRHRPGFQRRGSLQPVSSLGAPGAAREGVPAASIKLLSIFEPQTEAIRKGKAAKPTEFGKLVKIQEAEAGLITSAIVRTILAHGGDDAPRASCSMRAPVPVEADDPRPLDGVIGASYGSTTRKTKLKIGQPGPHYKKRQVE